MNARGRLFVISGPSGSGKTTLVAGVKALPGVYYSVSVTSRRPRPGEVDGRDYFFVAKEEFERRIAAGHFAEWAEVAGNFYGTPKEPLERAIGDGRTAIVDIDVQGAMQIKEKFPEARLIFIEPPSMEALEKRLRRRGTESEEAIRRRLDLARKEIEYAPRYDARILNDELDAAKRELEEIIKGEEA